jgi:hypothetical protein
MVFFLVLCAPPLLPSDSYANALVVCVHRQQQALLPCTHPKTRTHIHKHSASVCFFLTLFSTSPWQVQVSRWRRSGTTAHMHVIYGTPLHKSKKASEVSESLISEPEPHPARTQAWLWLVPWTNACKLPNLRSNTLAEPLPRGWDRKRVPVGGNEARRFDACATCLCNSALLQLSRQIHVAEDSVPSLTPVRHSLRRLERK